MLQNTAEKQVFLYPNTEIRLAARSDLTQEI